MNPTQALELLDNVCQQVSMNRQSHLNAIQALTIVRDEIKAAESLRAALKKEEAPK